MHQASFHRWLSECLTVEVKVLLFEMIFFLFFFLEESVMLIDYHYSKIRFLKKQKQKPNLHITQSSCWLERVKYLSSLRFFMTYNTVLSNSILQIITLYKLHAPGISLNTGHLTTILFTNELVPQIFKQKTYIVQ